MLIYIILGFLKNFDLNGYQIKQRMDLGTSNFMDASYGSLYPALKKLNEKGYITMKETIEHGKLSKIYSLTKEGDKYFMEWLKIPADLNGRPHDHLVKLYFYDHLSEKDRVACYKAYMQAALDEKERLKAIIPDARLEAGHERQKTLAYGIYYYDNMANFYKDLIKNPNKDILN